MSEQLCGQSEWFTITQGQINQFADVTQDHQYLHVDRERAAKTPFGGTIAHGFLYLSLLPSFNAGRVICPAGGGYRVELRGEPFAFHCTRACREQCSAQLESGFRGK